MMMASVRCMEVLVNFLLEKDRDLGKYLDERQQIEKENLLINIGIKYDFLFVLVSTGVVMPPTLKKLMGHIAFGACVSGWVTLFVPTVTFKPLKLES